ncbi:MAG: hypothetical protein GYB37_14590 [Algicola sp.]|nr:hypothetical protein [Algicola sp.]
MDYRRFDDMIKKIGLIWLWLGLCTLNPMQAQTRPAVSVMSFNIRAGYGIDGDFDLLRIGNQIKKARPDIVYLQEVDYRTKRSQGKDITLELANSTGLHSFFGKAIPFDGGEYGLAILSKYPILTAEVHSLPNQGNAEPRIALEAMLQVEGLGKLRVVNVHLDHSGGELNLAQIRYVKKKFSGGLPTILAGDFNQTMESETMQELGRDWNFSMSKNEYTYPSNSPNTKIDYIMVHPRNKWEMKNAQVFKDSRTSDHLPIMATFYFIK